VTLVDAVRMKSSNDRFKGSARAWKRAAWSSTNWGVGTPAASAASTFFRE
jgi:hypothetical protein